MKLIDSKCACEPCNHHWLSRQQDECSDIEKGLLYRLAFTSGTIYTGNGLPSASSNRMRGLGAWGCQPGEPSHVLFHHTKGFHTPPPPHCSVLTAASPGDVQRAAAVISPLAACKGSIHWNNGQTDLISSFHSCWERLCSF